MVHHDSARVDEFDRHVRVLRALPGHPQGGQGQPRFHAEAEGLHFPRQLVECQEPVRRQQHPGRSDVGQGNQPHRQATQRHQRGNRKRGQAGNLPVGKKPEHLGHRGGGGSHGWVFGDGHRHGQRVLGHGGRWHGPSQRHQFWHQAGHGHDHRGFDRRHPRIHGVQPFGQPGEQGDSPHGGKQPRVH